MAKIKSIKKFKHKGKVHDLTVKDVHAYNIEGLSVHNSAVGSLALYVLGITKLDPIKYDLLFERFLNPERISPPDVDVDFDYFRRDELYDYLFRKYGEDKCCKIGTYQTLQSKAIIRRCAKAIDIGNDWKNWENLKKTNPRAEMPKRSMELGDALSKLIPVSQTEDTSIKTQLDTNVALKMQMAKYPRLSRSVRNMEGVFSSAGIHPAGIIVCKDRVDKYVPLRIAKGQTCSQFDGPEVEDLGLLKFDLLALKTLTAISRTVKTIKERHGIDLDIDRLEPNDKNVFALLNGQVKSMDNRGIFQFESPGMVKLLKNINVDSFNDMIAANALYRPGPLGAGVHELYADYKNGRKEVKPLHPKMGEILKDTYSLIVYQENFMMIAQQMAGFTKGQSDTLRKAVGKKKMKLLKEQKSIFIEGCKNNGIDLGTASKVFEQIEYFGGYGFNKCLSGEMTVLNKIDGQIYKLEDLSKGSYGIGSDNPVVLDSYLDGEIVEDDLVEVFETGEKEVFEVELDNGSIVECTLDHKFICSDGLKHPLSEIIEKDLDIVCFDE